MLRRRYKAKKIIAKQKRVVSVVKSWEDISAEKVGRLSRFMSCGVMTFEGIYRKYMTLRPCNMEVHTGDVYNKTVYSCYICEHLIASNKVRK